MLKPGHMAWCLLILVIRRVRDWIWWNLSYQTCTVQFARKISVVTPCGSPRYLRPVFIPCALDDWIKNDNIRESYLRTLLQNVTPFKVMRVMYYCRQKKTARLHWQINRKHRIRGNPEVPNHYIKWPQIKFEIKVYWMLSVLRAGMLRGMIISARKALWRLLGKQRTPFRWGEWKTNFAPIPSIATLRTPMGNVP